jgi:hypothetical protein
MTAAAIIAHTRLVRSTRFELEAAFGAQAVACAIRSGAIVAHRSIYHPGLGR